MSNLRTDTGYQGAVAVTPSDTVAISHPTGQAFTKGLYIGVTGDVVALMADGDTVTFKAVPVGVLPVSVVRVNTTSTTATNILALY
jgi:hypothetical protein